MYRNGILHHPRQRANSQRSSILLPLQSPSTDHASQASSSSAAAEGATVGVALILVEKVVCLWPCFPLYFDQEPAGTLPVGKPVGKPVGNPVGKAVGNPEGSSVGIAVGIAVGRSAVPSVGNRSVGKPVGKMLVGKAVVSPSDGNVAVMKSTDSVLELAGAGVLTAPSADEVATGASETAGTETVGSALVSTGTRLGFGVSTGAAASAVEEGTTTASLLALTAGAALELATTAALELETTALPPPVLAQAKLIFVTGVPESLGLLKSQVMSTYGQQTLSVPTFAMSPLTKTLVSVTAAPTLAPVLSMTWNEVPA